jgi:RNA 2',3'-cyclic 3'-phosphodiesterase
MLPTAMRLFFAIELEPAVADALHQAIEPLRVLEPELAWVVTAKLHLTMKFVGEVDDAGAARLIGAAESIVGRHRHFEMMLGGVGAFPNFRRARVVWMGIENEPRLEWLHHDLEIACADAGYELEGRAFRPHITLARVRAPLPIERVRALARAARRIAFAGAAEVAGLTLFESTLGPGAHYRRIHAATLGGR